MSCIIPQRVINPRYRKLLKTYDINSFDDIVKIGVRNLKSDLKSGIPLKDSMWSMYSSYIFNSDISQYEDRDDFYIDVSCGRCINCLRSRANNWRIRLMEEYRYMSSESRNNSYFVTLTIKPEYYEKITKEPAKYIRRFLDRVRKQCGNSPRHFIVTEYGENTDRYHFHGIFFDFPTDIYNLEDLWKYGFVVISRLNERRVAYVASYITKQLDDLVVEPKYVEKIFVSPGLGKAYTEDPYNHQFHRRNGEPIPIMINDSGMMQLLPRYFRNKLFTEEELDNLKIAYFANQYDGVIPDPPYFIGKRKYDDYTLFLKDAEQVLFAYRQHYYKPHYNNIIDTPYEL